MMYNDCYFGNIIERKGQNMTLLKLNLIGPLELTLCKECGRAVEIHEGKLIVVGLVPETVHSTLCDGEESEEPSIVRALVKEDLARVCATSSFSGLEVKSPIEVRRSEQYDVIIEDAEGKSYYFVSEDGKLYYDGESKPVSEALEGALVNSEDKG